MGSMMKDEMQWRSESTYWLARAVLYRAMGFVYLVAFLVSAQQNKALIGDLGLSPVRGNLGTRPTPVFSLIGFGDAQLDIVAWLGVVCSVLMLFAAISSWVLPLCCWLLYLSIVNLQSEFIMGYGWEWQVLETGFLIIFLYPFYSRSPFPKDFPAPFIVIVLCRWLAFRVMLGTGMSKLGSGASECWRDLTCTTTHYETQPIPNAVAWFMHHLPLPIHKLECAIALFVEVPAPFLMLVPLRNIRILGGLIPICLMAVIVFTGSYAYINWITLVPIVACFDDSVLRRFFPAAAVAEAQHSDAEWVDDAPVKPSEPLPVLGNWADVTPRYNPSGPRYARSVSNACVVAERMLIMLACSVLGLVVAVKSQHPLREMRSASPWLQFYDDYFLVNAYGVFGFINKERIGLGLEFTHDGDTWKVLDFPAVPGSADRMPAYITPYHHRADWQVWIETTASMESNPLETWAYRGVPEFMRVLFAKLLAGDTQAASLLAAPTSHLFRGGKPPIAVRATPYKYTFSRGTSVLHGKWWHRERFLGAAAQFMKPVVLQDVETGPISHLPPTRDWVLLYSTFGIVATLIALIRPPSHRSEHCLYAAMGTWLAATGFFSLASFPVWKSAWIVAAAMGFAAASGSLSSLRKAFAIESVAADSGFSQKRSVCTSSILCLLLGAFFATLSGFHGASAGVLWLAFVLEVAFLIVAARREFHYNGLLIAIVALTLQALLCAARAAMFAPPAAQTQ